MCETTHEYGYYTISDPSNAKPGDIWYSDSHTEIVIEPDDSLGKVKLIGSNNYDKSTDKVECLQNHSTNSKYSSDATDYQRVTEQYRKYEKGQVCSRH